MADSNRCFIESRNMAACGIRAVFSLRTGGVSPPPFDSLNFGRGLGDRDECIERNLEILMQATDLSIRPHRATQVHGVKTLLCRGPGEEHRQQADILIGQGVTAVAVCTADCLPVLLADPKAGVIAAVHAGWRGTTLRVAALAVERMRDCGARPDRLLAWIGPGIGPCCFHIDAKTAADIERSIRGASQHIRRSGKEFRADLAAINALQLECAGLAGSRIERAQACTCCDPFRFYSHRRDGARSGHHLALIAVPECMAFEHKAG